MVRLITESQIRQYWDELSMWEWEYFVQNIAISKDFIRQMRDRFDWLKWDDIFRYQENIEQRGFIQFRDRPEAQDVYIIMEHPNLSDEFKERFFGTKNIIIREKEKE